MKVSELIKSLESIPSDYEVVIVYEGKDGTVLEDVTEWNINGTCIQLEAEQWNTKYRRKLTKESNDE